ncbi:MAG: LPS export ABC transporter periplasmic protein LptC [Motiliproteus sp.]
MNRKRVKLALSMTASALILLLWGFLEPERPTLLSQPEYIGEVDAYVSGVTIQQYDVNGVLTHSVKGDRVRHLPNDGSTLIDQPHLTLFRENKAPITATARFGEIEPDHETLWLREDAVVFNQLDQRFRLESSYLKILTKQQLAETDADVILYQPIGATYATGLTVDFATNNLQLHHAVRGTYEPN